MDPSYSKCQKALLAAVETGTLKQVTALHQPKNLNRNKNWFDYILLTKAFERKHKSIIHFLLRKECRVRREGDNSQNTPLYCAVKLGDIDIIGKILKRGGYPRVEPYNANSPLYLAMMEKKYNAVNAILSLCNFGDVNPENNDDQVHFHIACIMSNLTVMEMFVTRGFSVNSCSADSLNLERWPGFTPLHFAVENRCPLTFAFLLRHDADLSAKNSKGCSPLHLAYGTTFISQIITPLQELPVKASFNSANENGFSILHICCIKNLPNIIQLLFDNGVDLNHSVHDNSKSFSGYTGLHFAVQHELTNVVELLLKHGADINKIDKAGLTPIYLACKRRAGHAIIKVLLDHDVDLNLKDNSGYTVLHFAVYHELTEVVELLLQHGANVNGTTKAVLTSLHLACKRRASHKIIKLLLDHGASVTLKDNKNQTPLHYVFYTTLRDDYIIDSLLERTPVDANPTDSRGLTYFHIACTRKNPNHVQTFLQNGVSANLYVDPDGKMYSGYSALHFAVSFNRKNVVQLLLKHNANVNTFAEASDASVFYNSDIGSDYAQYSKVTPLHLACANNWTKFYQLIDSFRSEGKEVDPSCRNEDQIEITELLLHHKADVNAKDSSGKSPLIYACEIYTSIVPTSGKELVRNTQKGIVSTLLRYNADIHVHTDSFVSVLHMTCKSNLFIQGHVELAELFLENGANVHVTNENCMTPLHVAVKHEQKELVLLFLKYNANIEAKTDNLLTPLHVAVSSGVNNALGIRHLIVETLLKNGSDVNVRCSQGETPLHKAFFNYNLFAAKQLLRYGANIISEDSQGNPTFHCLTKSRSSPDSLEFKVIEFVEIHVKRLTAIGFSISDKTKECFFRMQLRFGKANSNGSDEIGMRCAEELEELKLIRIDSYSSLYDILRKDQTEVAKCVRNEELKSILTDSNFENDFPLYNDLLTWQYERGWARNALLEPAKSSLEFVIGMSLPDSCSEHIFQYLNNNNINNLIRAKPTTDNIRKRKLNNIGDTENDGSVAKQQRLK